MSRISATDWTKDYVILSGGLGSSPYVQDRLRWQFNEQTTANIPAAIGLNILAAEEPQLAVVHGLVLDQAQQVSQTLNPITSRFARVSYGIVVNQRYDPKNHQGVTPTKDPRDGKKWVVDRIEWLIRQVSWVLSLQLAVVLIDGSGRDDPSRWVYQTIEG